MTDTGSLQPPAADAPGLSLVTLQQLRGICPVVMHTPDGSHRELVGTGFFVTRFGHFVTARHVALAAFDLVGSTSGVYAARHYRESGLGMHVVQFHPRNPRQLSVTVRGVTGFTMLTSTDLAIGYSVTRPGIAAVETPFARLSVDLPEVGEIVEGTHLAASSPMDRGFGIEASRGPVTALCDPSGEDAWNCHHFRARISSPSGSSGCPVFSTRGGPPIVLGCLSSSDVDGEARILPTRELLSTEIPMFLNHPTCHRGTLQDYHSQGCAHVVPSGNVPPAA